MKNVQKIDLGLTGYDELFANDEERRVNKLAVLVTCKVLNGLGIDALMDQICDIGMSQKMRCHIKVQSVVDAFISPAPFSKLRRNRVMDSLPVDVAIDRSLFRSADCDVMPYPTELRIGQRLSV